MAIGIESAHGFGDLCFNLSLIREIKRKYNDHIWVATKSHCKDALYNVPWVDKIIEIQQMHQGITKLHELGCNPIFQITQNIKFFEFRENDQNHSLIDTPLLTGRQLGLFDFDQRPIFIPTDQELAIGDKLIKNQQPTIAVESVYTSAQSWADKIAFDMIITKYASTHKILWLSNHGAPKIAAVDNMLRYSRRECIACLQACEIFFSVGSGYFCSALGLPQQLQPKQIVCLWIDDLYKYERRLQQTQWHSNIVWVHNHQELANHLSLLS